MKSNLLLKMNLNANNEGNISFDSIKQTFESTLKQLENDFGQLSVVTERKYEGRAKLERKSVGTSSGDVLDGYLN